MRISAGLPQGVTALLFDAARRRRRLEAGLVAALEEAGFAEVVLPIVDYLEPYEPLLTAADRAELYRFVDREGELLALRADFTPMLARLMAPLLSPHGGAEPALELPQRIFYRGDVVRFEEEHPGRQREFYQVGAELLGEAGETAEREMLRLFLTLLTAAAGAAEGSEPPRLRVVTGLAGALDRPLAAAAADPVAAAELARAVVHRQRGPVRAAGRVLTEVLERGVPDDPRALGARAAERLDRLVELAGELDAEHPEVDLSVDLAEFAQHVLDPDLAPAAAERSYYDGLVFRAYVGGTALPAGSGGRYDSLFSHLGARVPAVGFSLGLERLMADRSRPHHPRRSRPARLRAAAGRDAAGRDAAGPNGGGS